VSLTIVFLHTPEFPDASGNTVTALYSSPKLGPITGGVAKVVGYQRRTLSFATPEKMLQWASKEFNAGEPCRLEGDRVSFSAAAPAEGKRK
jgi:hypothetical protein